MVKSAVTVFLYLQARRSPTGGCRVREAWREQPSGVSKSWAPSSPSRGGSAIRAPVQWRRTTLVQPVFTLLLIRALAAWRNDVRATFSPVSALLRDFPQQEAAAMTLHPKSTLLELIQAVSDSARNDDEVVATVAYLINSGRVRLCGTFAGAKIAVRPSLKWVRTNPSETIRQWEL